MSETVPWDLIFLTACLFILVLLTVLGPLDNDGGCGGW